MDVATIKGVVDRLHDRGLIDAAADPKDKRRSMLSISPAHDEKVELLCQAGREISAATLDPLSDAEAATLVALLKKISR